MITRVVQRKRPRASALLVIGSAFAAVGLLATSVLATIPPPPADTTCTGTASGQLPNSIEVADKNHSASCTTPDGAIVDYIGSSANNQSSGTGLFDPFVRLQGSPTEQGFNTNAPVTFDAKTGTWTHAILVSAIPVVTIGGTRYWELFNDINETNSTKPISLNKVEIYFAPGPGGANITGYPGFAGFSPTEVYAFDGQIRINDVNSGSGRGDLRYLVPLTNIPTPAAGTWFVLYSQWGTTSTTYSSEGGFEEWKVRKAPNVSIVKTANPVGPVNAGSNIGFDITVSNTGAAGATNVTISDPLPVGAGNDLLWSLSPAFSGCSITPIATRPQTLNCTFATLAAGASLGPIHITSATTQADCAVVSNTATAASGNDGGGSATDTVTVQCGALLIKKESTKGTNPLVKIAGAEFCYSTASGCSTTNVTDNGSGDEDTGAAGIGSVCVSGLAPGTYYVNETKAPGGYGDATQANVAVTVANGTNCTSPRPAAAATATFTNAPLSDIQVNFRDGGSTETSATISCDNQTGTGSDTAAAGWDTSRTVTNVDAPTVVTCTITIDP